MDNVNKHRVITVDSTYPLFKCIPLSFQHLLGMFGSTILVTLIFHIDPSIVLLFNGIGTLVYIIATRFQVPAVLGSSFSYIAPVLLLISTYGYEVACGTFIVCGLTIMIVGIIVQRIGVSWLNLFLPPSAIGAIMIVIGLMLLPMLAENAGLLNPHVDPHVLTTFLVTLITCILGLIVFRGFLLTMIVSVAILFGYIAAFILGIVNTVGIINAPWLALPTIYTPVFNINAILTVIPVVLVIFAENLGHLLITANIIKSDIVKSPGLGRSFFGNGLSTFIAGWFGSVPDTIYAENIGIMAITNIFSIRIFIVFSFIIIGMAFVKKIAFVILSIPAPVMAGASFFLLGTIAVSGLRLLIESQVDLKKNRNLMTTAIVLACGVSGIQIKWGANIINGMCLSCLMAILISIILLFLDKLKITNDKS